jgi:hypothetical protein
MRNFFRILIFAVAAFFCYLTSTSSKINGIGLFVLLLILAIFFIGTFVTTFEANKKKIGGDGIPPYLKNVTRNLVVFGIFWWMIALCDVLQGKTSALSKVSTRFIYLNIDPEGFWFLIRFKAIVGLIIVIFGILNYFGLLPKKPKMPDRMD